MNKDTTSDFVDESSFDYKEWLFKIQHYWYVILIGVIVALCLAYLENRSWKPQFKVEGQIILGNSAPPSSYAFMQGFSSDGFSNNNDQLIMFGRYELIRRAIENLPLSVEVFTQGRFKTNYYYKNSPLEVSFTFVAPVAYDKTFLFSELENGRFSITIEDADQNKLFSTEGCYGEPFENSYFFGTIKKNTASTLNPLFFTIRSMESLESEFSSRLSFSMIEGTSVATVSLVGERVERDKDFLNALSGEFIKDNLDRKNLEANRTIDFIDSQLQNISDSLAVSSSSIRDFRRENNIVDVNAYTSGLLAQSAEFEKKKDELNLKESYFKYLDNYLKKNVQDGEILAPSTLGISDPLLLDLVNQLNDVQLKRSEVGEKNPYYEKYSKQMETLKKTLFEVLGNVKAVYQMDRANFDVQYNKVLCEIKQLPEKENQIIEVERRHQINDNYYTYLLQKRSEAQIRKASNASDNTILQDARVVSFVNGRVKGQTYIKFLMLGILIPILLIVLKELLNNTVKSVSELEKTSRFSVLSAIPYEKMSSVVLTVKNVKSVFSESFRMLRTRIEFLVQKNDHTSILVTSSESGDGKTFFSANMAGIYALSGKPTLLIDLDLRKPSVDKLLGLDKKYGVSNVLIGSCSLDSAIQKDESLKFDVLLAGTIPPNPGELLSSEKMHVLLETLKQRYEYIIIDTSPIGLVSDAYPLTKLVDLTLFVVFSGKTRKSFMKEIVSEMKKARVPNVYAVLNGAKDQRFSLGYGSYRTKNNKYYHTSDYFEDSKI